MKKHILLGIAILGAPMAAMAAEYLINPQASTVGEKITYKGVEYQVGTTAFADFAALAAANPEANSTVNVAPGTYATDATFTASGLNFLGNNAYKDWMSNRGDESVITGAIGLEANDITFNGFKFTANGRVYSQSATNAAPLSGIKVVYNYAANNTLSRSKNNYVIKLGNRYGDANAATAVANCRYRDCTVAHNYFAGSAENSSNCVGLAGIYGETKAFDNYFTGTGSCFFIDNAQGDIKIFNNVFKNVGKSSSAGSDSYPAGSFCVALYRSAFANTTNLYIQSNEFNGCYGEASYFCPIRIYPGSGTNLVDPQNLRVNINQNTFKNKTSVVLTNNGQAGHNMILYADKSTTANVRYNLQDNHYDNRYYKYAWVTLDDGLGSREIYADQFSEFLFGGKASTFGTSTLENADVASHAVSVSTGATTVIQSFDIDPKTGDMYFQQLMGNSAKATYNSKYGYSSNHSPLVVTRVPCTKIDGYKYTYSTAQSMNLGKAGHGTNMCLVRDKSGQLWIWGGALSDDNGTSDDKSMAIGRFKFAKGTDVNLDQNGTTDKGAEYLDFSGGNEYPAVDETSRYLCVRTTSGSKNTYKICDLDDALNGKKTLLKSVTVNKGDNANSEIAGDDGYLTWSFQSFDINGDYIYMLEGVNKTASNTSVSGLPTLVLSTYNWRTGQWCGRFKLNYGRINDSSWGEPEGFVIRPDEYGHVNAYVAISVGGSGARKASVYKYIIDYHRQWDATTSAPVTVGDDTRTTAHFTNDYTAITTKTDVNSLSFSVESVADVQSQKVTITNDVWHYGQWVATITGDDADAFVVTHPENNSFTSTVAVKVKFCPKEGRFAYSAALRLRSPLQSEIVIPITATVSNGQTNPDVIVNDNITNMTEVWNYSQKSGASADWIAYGAQVTQDMTFSNGKLYFVNRQSGSENIYIVNAYTGEKLGALNTESCTAGTYKLSSVETLGGKVIACNLITSATGVFTVYMWDDDASAPVKLLETSDFPSYTNSAGTVGYRLGDAMSVSGDLKSGKIWFVVDDKAFYYTVTDGVCSTTPTIISLTKNGAAYNVSQATLQSNLLVDTDGSLWISSKDIIASHFSATGEFIEAFGSAVLGNHQGTDLRFIDLGTKRYAVATTYLNKSATTIADGAYSLMNVTNGISAATAIGQFPSAGLGATRNTSFRSSLCHEITEDKLYVWIHVPFQGAACYAFTHNNVTSVDDIEVFEPENTEVEYYNLQGIRVENPSGGIYIRRCGNKVEKVLVR